MTPQDFGQVNTAHGEVGETHSLPIGLDTLVSMENIIVSNRSSDESANVPAGEIRKEVEPVSCDRITYTFAAITGPFGDDETQLLNQTELHSWLDRIASAKSASECMDCMDALHILPPSVSELIWKSAEILLPRFWEILGDGQDKAGSGFSGKVSQQQEPDSSDDRIIKTNGVEQKWTNPNGYVKNLIAGLWVRTRDGFYGHLGAMVSDGRWWVKSPPSRNSSAESRLYAAADIIPMPTS